MEAIRGHVREIRVSVRHPRHIQILRELLKDNGESGAVLKLLPVHHLPLDILPFPQNVQVPLTVWPLVVRKETRTLQIMRYITLLRLAFHLQENLHGYN